ncbi:MAG: serine/threonine-protein kinase PknK, partial [Myxococcales bacterium]|nr:serine/threonine-protein kinase PknK [Myxococcales bacterium]
MDKDSDTRAIDRFEIRRRLGAGAMGVVFEAYDRERDRIVALKTLPNAEANALYRFKREFRTLADISHPNLVNLYELFIEPEHCFFTMEVVNGESFLTYVRPESEIGDLETLAGWASHLDDPEALVDTERGAHEADAGEADTGETNAGAAKTSGSISDTLHSTDLAALRVAEGPSVTTSRLQLPPLPSRATRTLDSQADLGTLSGDDDTAPGNAPGPELSDEERTSSGSMDSATESDLPVRDPVRAGPLNLPRLREALRQLALGVAAIHAAGKLHRDLKPSNVLVTTDGRVVILDFGLATELGGERGGDGLTGTAAYMAPEQVEGQGAPASDWYAVGVMLFEALTGRRPFTGSLIQVLMDKRKRDPQPPKQFDPSIPDDLNDLCVRLLARDPATRPDAAEILKLVGGGAAAQGEAPPADLHADELVGRESQLADLDAAMATARAGDGVAAYVYGPSGTGKTAL